MKLRTLLLLLGLLGLVPAVEHVRGHTGSGPSIESFYADGRLKARIDTEGGQRHGRCTRFYPDGSVMAEGAYEKDLESGAWVWYRQDGTLDAERSGLYARGRKVADASADAATGS